MSSIKCGNCGQTHQSVFQVKVCYGPTAAQQAEKIATYNANVASGIYGDAERAKAQAAPVKLNPVERLQAASAQLPTVEGHTSTYYALYEVDFEAGGVNEGRWNFYRVDKPVEGKWAGKTFIKLAVSDTDVRLSFQRQLAVAEGIVAVGPLKAAQDYGHQIGKCAICHRKLTDPESIAAGIGPVCAGKL